MFSLPVRLSSNSKFWNRYNDGSVLTIDCEEVENHYDVTNGQIADLDWLLYNKPLEYASLVLSGEMEDYLKGPALHGIEE